MTTQTWIDLIQDFAIFALAVGVIVNSRTIRRKP